MMDHTTQIELSQRKPMARVETEFNQEQIDLIKRTVAKGATNDELALFLHTAKRTGLDPLTKQIHAIKRWDSSQNREVMAIQTGIDGYRLIADRTSKLAGIDDAVFDREDQDHPNKASVTVYKIVDGEKCAFTATARWREYVQTKKDGTATSMWKKMPYLMLAKCAEALALRKAFPADLSGVYTFEEMSQADNGNDEPEPPQQAQAPQQVKCSDCKKPITDYTLNGGGSLKAQQVAEYAQKKYGTALCGECMVARKGKTTPKAETFVETRFEKIPDDSAIEVTGIVRRCTLTEGPKPRLIIAFDDDKEVFSWRTKSTKAFVDKHCIGKTCVFLCDESKWGVEMKHVVSVDGQDASTVEFGISDEDIQQ